MPVVGKVWHVPTYKRGCVPRHATTLCLANRTLARSVPVPWQSLLWRLITWIITLGYFGRKEKSKADRTNLMAYRRSKRRKHRGVILCETESFWKETYYMNADKCQVTLSFWRARKSAWYWLSFLSDRSFSSTIGIVIASFGWLNSVISALIFSIWDLISENCLILSSFLALRSFNKGATVASCSFNDAILLSFCVQKWKRISNHKIL